jgi:hypothetical protein
MKLHSLQHKILSAFIDPANPEISNEETLKFCVYPPDSSGRVIVPFIDPPLKTVLSEMEKAGLLGKVIDFYYLPTQTAKLLYAELSASENALSCPVLKPTNSLWERTCYVPDAASVAPRHGADDHFKIKSRGLHV